MPAVDGISFDLARALVTNPEPVVADALSSIVDGNMAAAEEQLGEEFETVCELETPELAETDAGHPAACHRHDEPQAVETAHSAAFED